MTPEEFIKNNPFPKNGLQINNDLVKAIQDPKQAHNYKKNAYKLLKNNARLIYQVYKQFNYNQPLSSIMSFIYEGILTTSKEYRIGSPKPYYSYLMTYVRGLLQKHYNYNHNLIHVPVMKKKVTEIDVTEITNVGEHTYLEYREGEPMNEELDLLFDEYEMQKLPVKQRDDFEILKLSRSMTVKEISQKTGLGIGKIRNIVKRTVPRLQNFYKNKLSKMY